MKKPRAATPDAKHSPDREAALLDLLGGLLALRLGKLDPHSDAAYRLIADAYQAIGPERARRWGLAREEQTVGSVVAERVP